MKFFRQIFFIARIEWHFFSRFPKLLLATALVACIPAFYTVIYLSSVWDPAANSGSLPVGLVNLDEGVEYRDHVFNMGWDVANDLRQRHVFDFQDLTDPEDAKRQVRNGNLAFALIIPKDFSSNAVPGKEAGGGVFASLSPWLPLTWVVRGIKATMFDAYGGAWQGPLLVVATTGSLTLLCSSWIGSWRFVKPTSVRPAVDF